MNLKRKLAAAQRAMHTARDAFAAKQTPATKAAYLGALILALAAAKALGAADSTVSAKMKKVTERYSEKKERLEESDDEEEEEEEEASAATSADSESMSRSEKSSEEEEEEASPSTAKSEEEEEEEEERKGKRAKGGESEEEEEEEEEAVAKGWTAARRAYRKAAVGVDAYGLRGPKGLLAACEKALGVRGPSAVLGALAALPKRRKADDALAAQVVQLTTNARKQRVDAIVAKAKDEGRAPSKALRDSLRAAGAKNGTRWLAAHVATLPAIKRKRDQGADEHGNPINPPARSGQRADYQAGEVMGLGGLSDKDRELAQKIRGDIDNRKRANGAGRPVG